MFKVLFKHTCIAISALVLCHANMCFAAKKIDAAKEDLSEVKQKIESLKKELNNSQEAHHDAADALKDSETAISKANQKLREISQKQKQHQGTLADLKRQSINMNAQLADQQKQLSNLLYQQYAQGNQSYTRLLLQNKNPSQISRDLTYQSYIAKAHAKLIDDMQASLNQVKKLNAETTVTLQQVAELKTKQETERKELELQKREKAKVLKALSSKIAAQRTEIKKLSRDEKNLTSLVQKLAKIATKPRKKASTSKKASTTEKLGAAIATNEVTPDGRYSGVSFASLKGKLRLPVRGEIANRFGSAREDSGISWKGMFIKATEGTDVKSVASGRVVFADWMRGFGNLIIVDHGGGYMSLYGNNQSVLKHEGDEVDAGDTIAAVGNSGGNESDGLYYELRSQSKPFDPMSWSVVR